jgi:hypothetical protein
MCNQLRTLVTGITRTGVSNGEYYHTAIIGRSDNAVWRMHREAFLIIII